MKALFFLTTLSLARLTALAVAATGSSDKDLRDVGGGVNGALSVAFKRHRTSSSGLPTPHFSTVGRGIHDHKLEV